MFAQQQFFKRLILVGLGGGLGGALRYGLLQIQSVSVWLITLLLNVFGAFLLALLADGLRNKPLLSHFIGTGFLGGFTTFSAMILLIIDTGYANLGLGAVYFVGNLFLGMLAVRLGKRLGARLW